MAQNPYAGVETRLDTASNRFNKQNHKSNNWLLGGLLCFGLGLVTQNKTLVVVGLGCAGIAEGARRDNRANLRQEVEVAEREIVCIQRDKWRMQRVIRALMPENKV